MIIPAIGAIENVARFNVSWPFAEKANKKLKNTSVLNFNVIRDKSSL